ncbi:MAG TPA: hypothetical protein EYH26_00490 [Pyrodictium sp.]|nr:hypothetical protein [Pyrodictium sp.]HIQ56012.1 hypothetical protein [Pyrodictium sp.]
MVREEGFQAPCEIASKHVVPAIRAALAILLVNEYGLSAYRVAKLLGMTPAAISNYLLRRRGGELVDKLLEDGEIKKVLVELAEKLISDDVSEGLPSHLCRICRVVRRRFL